MPKPDRQERLMLVSDARGREVTQLDPLELRLRRRHDIIDANTLAKIADQVGSGLSTTGRRLLIALLVLAAVVTAVRIVDLSVTGGLADVWSRETFWISQIWFWGVVIWYAAKRARFGRIRRVMLQHELCPHCAYVLTGLPPDPEDGAKVCPECGCAWRLG